jgi:uncharacterized membrane protein
LVTPSRSSAQRSERELRAGGRRAAGGGRRQDGRVTASPALAVRPLGAGAGAVAAAFAVSGVVHLVRPEVFEPIVPRVLPRRRGLVLASGVAELVCAAGLALPATRRTAGRASAALLVAVFPANVQMALDAVRAAGPDREGRTRPGGTRARRTRARRTRAVVTLARLPVQWPLVRWAWRAGR